MDRKNTFSPRTSSNTELVKKEIAPPGAHIVVIGAGAFGGWSALFLQRSGYQVTLIDQWAPGNSRASSGGETRLIRCIYGVNPFYTKMANRAYTLWQEHEKLLGGQFLFPTGCLWFSDENADDLVRQALPIIKEEGLDYEILASSEVERRFPQIKSDGCEIIHEKKTGYLLARAGCMAVKELFIRNGGQYIQSYAIPDLSDGALEGIKLDNADHIKADIYLFACGPWLKSIFPEIMSQTLTITRQEVFYFGLPRERASWYESLPTWIDHSPPDYYYGIPGGIGRGFKMAFDRRGAEIDPTNQERNSTNVEVQKAKAYLVKRFHGMEDAPLIESRVCQYADTDDGNFIFDQHPEIDNAWILGGGSGHGYKHGPALGELVSQAFRGLAGIPGDLRKFQGTN